MKNYTIKERQEIYEHLLTLDCPDLLAALIAQRADKSFVQGMGYNIKDKHSLSRILYKSFIWCHTPEEDSFWVHIYEDCNDFEYSIPERRIELPTISDVIESTEREMFNCTYGADYVPDTEVDFTPAKIEINVDVSRFNQEMEKVNLTVPQPTRDGKSFKEFWTKVKLFFGKWFYKV